MQWNLYILVLRAFVRHLPRVVLMSGQPAPILLARLGQLSIHLAPRHCPSVQPHPATPSPLFVILPPMCCRRALELQKTCLEHHGVGLGFGKSAILLAMEVDVVDMGVEHVPFEESFLFVIEEGPEDLGNGEARFSIWRFMHVHPPKMTTIRA